ncbi:MAG: hypothetical protein K9K67_16055 [Bacteriovoracaceae bacterium]|nr:hypothetical protein [Bacteriovoracaceae bacterium]
MKIFITMLATLVALIATSTFAIDVEQKEMAKKQLTNSYNAFKSMDDREYKKSLNQLASAARKADLIQEAQLFEKLAKDPASRFEILAQMKEQIEKSSENGIYFIIYLMYPQTWCFAGDLRCGFGVGILSILTLEGEEAADL